MELRQVAYFEAVVRLGGFSRAAEQLCIAQPAISVQIKNLERELGTTLLQRTTRRATLTEAGVLFLEHARAMLAEVDGIHRDLDRLAQVVRGRLRIGVAPVLGPLDLPDLVAGFHRRYPSVEVEITTGSVNDLLGKLDSGQVDVLLAPIHSRLPTRFITQVVATEQIVLLTPPGHLPKRPANVPLSAVRDELFICLSEGTRLNEILMEAARNHNFQPQIKFRVPDPTAIQRFVAAGLGVALVAASTVPDGVESVDVRRLRPAIAHPPIGQIFTERSTATATRRAWLEHVAGAQRTN